MATPVVNTEIYPTKDAWKAVWYAFSPAIAAATITGGNTTTVFGVVYTVSQVKASSTGVAGTVSVTDPSGVCYEFPNYIAPGYAATPTVVPYSISVNQPYAINGYFINV